MSEALAVVLTCGWMIGLLTTMALYNRVTIYEQARQICSEWTRGWGNIVRVFVPAAKSTPRASFARIAELERELEIER